MRRRPCFSWWFFLFCPWGIGKCFVRADRAPYILYTTCMQRESVSTVYRLNGFIHLNVFISRKTLGGHSTRAVYTYTPHPPERRAFTQKRRPRTRGHDDASRALGTTTSDRPLAPGTSARSNESFHVLVNFSAWNRLLVFTQMVAWIPVFFEGIICNFTRCNGLV